ncbi:hypothetical protein [Streptomyces alboniger]|uniref:Uncharacterized protein n=1 Tax=Streptomyces alboniger TaxID=132473 RepID=A0A5J6HHC5_STRAD|nr:hypothetical protein [Streptomyces alboniger]QEV17781.1 hypothetical protein CP975_09925 [Streptomyces alboniger]
MARTRNRTGYGQLLLLAALLFGIVAMHTLGHPLGGHGGGGAGAGSAGPGGERQVHRVEAGVLGAHGARGDLDRRPESPAGHAPPSGGHDVLAGSDVGVGHAARAERATRAGYEAGAGHAVRAGHETRTDPVTESASDPHRGVGMGTGTGMDTGTGTGTGMDPLSVCLAVLAAFTLVLLVRAGLLRPGGTLVPGPAAGLLPGAPRPEAPPPRVQLSRLSVLRI